MIHSSLGASSTKRWMNCPGSVNLSKDLPNNESRFAAEGTFAHNLAEKCLKFPNGPSLKPLADAVLETGEPIPEEMAEAVSIYVRTIIFDLKEYSNDKGTLGIESKFHLDWIDKRCFGTNDCSILIPFKKLIIYDFKYGAGIPVEVENNPQLLYYALGALRNTETEDWHDVEEIELVIIQPRAPHHDGPVRRWTCNIKDLDYFEHELKQAIKKVDECPEELNAGDHCTFCNAKAHCPALHKKAQEIAKSDFTKITDVQTLTGDQLASVINFKSVLNKFIDACEERATEMLKSGQEIKGLKLVRSRTQRKWADAEDAEAALAHYGTAIFETKFKSPAAMEKIVEDKKELEPFIIKELGELVAAPITDKRKAEKLDAKADFTLE